MYKFELIDNSGYVIPSTFQIPYRWEPIGWDSATFTLARHADFHGVFSDFSIDLEFICGGGYEFIRALYDVYGVEADITLNIYQDCGNNGAFVLVYFGKLNLSEVEFNLGIKTVKANIEQGGQVPKLLSRLNVDVDLFSLNSIDNPTPAPADLPAYTYAPYDLTITGKTIQELSAVSVEEDVFCCSFAAPPNTVDEWKIVTGLALPSVDISELPTIQGVDCQTVYSQENVPVNFRDAIAPVFTAVEAGVYEICFTGCLDNLVYVSSDFALSGGLESIVSLSITGQPDYNVFTINTPTFVLTPVFEPLDFCCETFGELTTYALQINLLGAVISYTAFVSLNPGDTVKWWHTIEYDWTAAGFTDLNICSQVRYCDKTKLSIRKAVKFEDTISKVFAVWESFARIIKSITTPATVLQSSYFGRTNTPTVYPAEGCGAFTVITNGLLLRGFPDITTEPEPASCFEEDGTNSVAPVQMPMSLNRLFANMNAIWNIGMGIDLNTVTDTGLTVIIEEKEYFYNNTVVLTIENIDFYEAKVKETVVNELIINNIEAGFQTWETETRMGVTEINTPRTYSSGSKVVDYTLDISADFVASDYAIEETRSMIYSDTANEDTDYDNEVFVLAVKQDTAFMDEVEVGVTNPVNIPYPAEVRNFRLSPFNNLIRWANYLCSYYDVFRFTKGEGNYTAAGADVLTGCNQAEHIENQELDFTQGRTDRYLLARALSLDYPITFTQYNSIKSNPYGRVRVYYTGVDYKDYFLSELKFKPNDISQFTLIEAR